VSSHTENWMSVVGLIFVLVVLFFPRGILGLLRPGGRPASPPPPGGGAGGEQ
jgi:branched-chain amino acid transport system permease protein